MPFGPTHTLLRGLAGFAFASFWHRVETHTHVDGYDGDPERLVPDEGTPIIVVANHHNSAADVSPPRALCLTVAERATRWGRSLHQRGPLALEQGEGVRFHDTKKHANSLCSPSVLTLSRNHRSPSCRCTFLTTANCTIGQSRPSLPPDSRKRSSSTLATCP
jgi:hypothetical protein